MDKSTVYILVGAIASGKTTFAKKKAKEGMIIINDDSIVNMLHCNNYKLYSEYLKPLYKSIENIALQMAIALGRDVIIDRPNYSKGMRRRYIAIAKSLDAKVAFVIFPKRTNEVHAERRVASDGRGFLYEDWLEVAKRHDELFEQVSLDEGADEIIYLD